MNLLLAFNILTFIIMLRYTVKAIYRISKGKDSLGNFTLLFIMFFNGIPLILDVLFGFPKYGSAFIGFNQSISHLPSSIIYNFYFIVVFFIINRYSLKHISSRTNCNGFKKIDSDKKIYTINDVIKDLILVSTILLPLFHVIISPYRERFLVYGSASMRGITDTGFNELNAMLRMLSLALLSIWILGEKRRGGFIETLLFLLFSFILIWIDGKRYIIAFILVIVFYALWKRGRIKGKKILLYMPIGVIVLLIIATWYQIVMRSSYVDYSNFDLFYRGIRLDYSRDAVVKLAIYSEITSFPKILDYRGQSFLSLLLMFVPRAIWGNKPYQYTRYITAAIFQIPPESVTYGITYSIFDQCIANFGLYIGLPFAIWFLLKLIQVGDKSNDNTTKLLVLLVIISSLTMNLAYIAPIILVLIGKILIVKLLSSDIKIK